MEVVETSKEDTEHHLSDTEDDRQFHFEGVEEGKFVTDTVPARIDTERIGTFTIDFGDSISRDSVSVVSVVAGSKDIPRHGHEIIVHPTAIEGEETLEQEEISTLEDKSEHTLLILFNLFFENAEIGTKGKQKTTVTDITEHDTEKEGEGGNGEKTRVDFSISRSTVCIDDFLEDPGDFVESEMSRGLDVTREGSFLEVAASDFGFTSLEFSDGLTDFVRDFNRAPAASLVQGLVGFKGIEVVINSLFFQKEESKVFNEGIRDGFSSGLSKVFKESLDSSLSKTNNILSFSNLGINFSELIVESSRFFRNTILGSTERFTDSVESAFHHIEGTTLIDDEEDGLILGFSGDAFFEVGLLGLGILLFDKLGLDDVGNGSEGHSSGNSEQDLFESASIFSVDNTSQVAKSNISPGQEVSSFVSTTINYTFTNVLGSEFSVTKVRLGLDKNLLVFDEMVIVFDQSVVALDLFVQGVDLFVNEAFKIFEIGSFGFISG
jgi:hypothetical protein